MPVFIRTKRSVPPAKIRDSPDSLASSAAAALVVVGASNLMDDSLPFALSRFPSLSPDVHNVMDPLGCSSLLAQALGWSEQ